MVMVTLPSSSNLGWLKSKVPVHSEPRNQIGFLACPSGEDVRRQHRQQTQWPDAELGLETIHRFHNQEKAPMCFNQEKALCNCTTSQINRFQLYTYTELLQILTLWT